MPLLGFSYFWSYDCLDAESGVPTLFVEGNKIDVFALKNMDVNSRTKYKIFGFILLVSDKKYYGIIYFRLVFLQKKLVFSEKNIIFVMRT